MVLRVKPTPTRFPTNSLNIPMNTIPLHSISSVCHPWGILLLLLLLLLLKRVPRALEGDPIESQQLLRVDHEYSEWGEWLPKDIEARAYLQPVIPCLRSLHAQ